jgi:hypothetical protein
MSALACSECFAPLHPRRGQTRLTCSLQCRTRRSRRKRVDRVRTDARHLLERMRVAAAFGDIAAIEKVERDADRLLSA